MLSGEVKARGEQAREAEAELQEVLRTLPNLPDPTAAEPEDEVLRVVGEDAPAARAAATTSSSPASGSTWSAARGCRARASRSCAAIS